MINTTELKKVITSAQKVIPKNAYQPILENCHLKITGDSLTVVTTNLDRWYKNKITVNNTDGIEFKTTINCNTFLKILKVVKDKNISLNLDVDDGILKIKTSKTIYKISTIAASEFPEIEKIEFSFLNSIQTDMLKKVSIASTTYDDCNILSSINYNTETNKLCSLDGNRLHSVALNKKPMLDDININIPNSVAKVLLLDNYELFYSENYVQFKNENEEIIIKLLKGKFPNYELLMPQHNNKTLGVNSKDLRASIKEIELTINNKTNICFFKFKLGKVLLCSETPDIGTTETSIKYLDKETKDLDKIAFNYTYLKDLLTLGEVVKFRFDNSLAGALIEFDTDYKCLIMPVQLR